MKPAEAVASGSSNLVEGTHLGPLLLLFELEKEEGDKVWGRHKLQFLPHTWE